MYVIVKERGSFLLTKCMEFVFHSFCHRPDECSLKLKPVAWLRAEGVCAGCDCTIDKSKIYFLVGYYFIKCLQKRRLNK
jgi:hypothetical protein